jgi:hypothetical protein
VAIQGIWSPQNLPFLELNNTSLVFLKVCLHTFHCCARLPSKIASLHDRRVQRSCALVHVLTVLFAALFCFIAEHLHWISALLWLTWCVFRIMCATTFLINSFQNSFLGSARLLSPYACIMRFVPPFSSKHHASSQSRWEHWLNREFYGTAFTRPNPQDAIFRYRYKFTPEVLWGTIHGALGLFFMVWWQGTVGSVTAARKAQS